MSSFTQEQLDLLAAELQPSINTHLEALLTERIAALRVTLEKQMAKSQKTGWDTIAAQLHSSFENIRSQLPDEIRKATPSSVHVPEPPVLSDCSYSGGHPALRGFLHVIRDSLSSKSQAFSDDSARINWVARHFKPIGGSSNNWWMGLLQENAVAQGVRNHYQFSGLPLVIPPLSSLDAFLSAMVEEFGDKLAHETALKNLQDCKMGNMKIGDFNSHFKSLSGLVLDAPESIRMDYYKRALSAPVRRQAILRADWASTQTLAGKMTIATLASQQLDEANGISHSKHLHPSSTHQMITVPPDSDSMEVDAINLSSSHPSSFPKKAYVDECKRQKLCTRCLSSYNDTHRTASGSATCPNAAASLQSKIDFLKNSKRTALPKSVSHPPSGPPQPVHRPVAAVTTPAYPVPPPLFPWPHPHPGYPYGYPPYPPAPPFPHPVTLPGPTNVQPPPNLQAASTSVSAVFSEYADLYQPVYYDLPGVDLSATVPPSSIEELPPSPPPIQSVNVSAMTFTGSSRSDSRLILSVMLLAGKRLIPAKALVDSGSGGDFISSSFIQDKNITALPRPFPIRCTTFDGSPSIGGDVTQYWEGHLTMIGDHNALFDAPIKLDVTTLGGYDLILGIPWLKKHDSWVGGAGPALWLEHTILLTADSQGNIPFSSPIPVSSSIQPSSVPDEFQLFSQVSQPQKKSTLPHHRPGYDIEVNLKPGCVPPSSNAYLLSQAEEAELRAYVEVQLAKGFIRKLSSPASSPFFFAQVEGKANRPCVEYRGFNSMTVRDTYPLPLIDSLLSKFLGCKRFSQIDLKTSFNLLQVAEGHEWKTAFKTPQGLYEYLVMPFGLANAPAYFQRLIQSILSEYLNVFLLCLNKQHPVFFLKLATSTLTMSIFF